MTVKDFVEKVLADVDRVNNVGDYIEFVIKLNEYGSVVEESCNEIRFTVYKKQQEAKEWKPGNPNPKLA